MSDFSYIQIALRGEVQGATRTIYSYPSEGAPVDPHWNAMMAEPEAVMKRFLNATECYVLQSAPTGHYMSLITRNPLHPEEGYVMISLLIDNSCSLTGRQVMNIFNNLKRTLLEEDLRTDAAVNASLQAASVPVEPVHLESWTYRPPEGETHNIAEAAYRTYISVQDLESIFSFPAQPDYASYRCILVVSATTSLRPGARMPRLTAPIRKQFSLICPPGVTASQTLAYDGDRITLTYSKQGFNTHKETIVAGIPSVYTKYEGSTINIRTAAQTGIRFVRRIPVRVLSTKGDPLQGYTITVNGRSIPTMDPFIEFTEKDLAEGSEVEIRVVSNNYRPLKLNQSSEKLLAMDELMLELNPVEQGITLRLDFGDGRVFEQQISIERNTPEYTSLRAGNFHGFRAMRQVTGDNSEIYNVDLSTPAPAPAAVSGPTAETDPEQTPIAPKFENISDEQSPEEETPRIDTTPISVARRDERNLHDQSATPHAVDDDDDDDDDVNPRRSRRTLLFLCCFIAVVAIVIAGLWIFRQGDNAPAATDPQMEEIAQSDSVAAAAPAGPMTPEEQADADYLNSSPVWDLERLKSPMGIALAKALTEGNLEGVATNDYFTVNGRCTNPRANEIVDMAWRAIGSPNQHGNSRKMRGSVKKGSVNLRELSDAMARIRPAEQPNERPRPRK